MGVTKKLVHLTTIMQIESIFFDNHNADLEYCFATILRILSVFSFFDNLIENIGCFLFSLLTSFARLLALSPRVSFLRLLPVLR